MDLNYTLVLSSLWHKFTVSRNGKKRSTRKFLAVGTFVTEMFHGINPGHETKRSNWTGHAPCFRYLSWAFQMCKEYHFFLPERKDERGWSHLLLQLAYPLGLYPKVTLLCPLKCCQHENLLFIAVLKAL